MELKTIKDFEFDIDSCCPDCNENKREKACTVEDLKQEAIKDIKAIQTLGKTPEDKMWEEITKKIIVYSKDAKQGIINYIKWKFNITEEDLK